MGDGNMPVFKATDVDMCTPTFRKVMDNDGPFQWEVANNWSTQPHYGRKYLASNGPSAGCDIQWQKKRKKYNA